MSNDEAKTGNGHIGYVVMCDSPAMRFKDEAMGLWPSSQGEPDSPRILLSCRHVTMFEAATEAEDAIRRTFEYAKRKGHEWADKRTSMRVCRVYHPDGRPEDDLRDGVAEGPK